MKECTKCLINSNYPNITFSEKGECSLCNSEKIFKPIGEDILIDIFNKAKNKKRQYDALVPLSGGKDSSYILHLAVNIYKLNVITMTYDNGFLSELALININEAVKKTKVKHIWYKPDMKLQRKIFKYLLLNSGDMCGACDIGTKASIIKIAKQYKVPLILYGTSPLEEDSFLPDSIQDIVRFKYILKQTNKFTKKDINSFLIFPKLNYFKLSIMKNIGILGKEIRPLFYINNPTDKEMGEIIKKELNWKDNHSKEYTKHFDCIAEPFTNYVRNKIYGYERRLCQYSNMIRKNEISCEKAKELYLIDNINEKPENTISILKMLDIEEKQIDIITSNKPLKYENKISKINKIYSLLMKIIRNKH